SSLFTPPPPTELSPLSLHDALPIYRRAKRLQHAPHTRVRRRANRDRAVRTPDLRRECVRLGCERERERPRPERLGESSRQRGPVEARHMLRLRDQQQERFPRVPVLECAQPRKRVRRENAPQSVHGFCRIRHYPARTQMVEHAWKRPLDVPGVAKRKGVHVGTRLQGAGLHARRASSASATTRSVGVVTLRFSTSPSITSTRTPQRATIAASSVALTPSAAARAYASTSTARGNACGVCAAR